MHFTRTLNYDSAIAVVFRSIKMKVRVGPHTLKFAMFRRKIRKYLPTVDHFERLPWARPFKRFLGHPNIWALNRKSIAGGVAAGLFCGLIPGPFQIFGSLLWVLVAKVNMPVAFAVTLYTNPVTIVPLYLIAVAYGDLLLGGLGESNLPPIPEWNWSAWGDSTHAMVDWMLSMGPSLAVGLPALMVTLSILGYFSVRLAWNIGVRIAVVRRRRRNVSATR
tara:strand:- start:1424 stop:2083 length:660 start_codon:yes stop_codon:yes gene_type:complete